MNGKRMMAGILLMGILAATLAGCKNTEDSEKETEKSVITLGSDNYPPYNYLNEDGIPTGIDVELATEAFQRMGYQVDVVQINWEEKKDLVESGEIDCIMGCFSMEGRLDDYRWAGPYIASRQVVAVNENSEIYKLSDLEGKNLAVQSTTKPEGIFLNRTDDRIPACARKDAPGIVAIYYYTSPEFARNYTLTIQGLLNGYSVQKDGTILVADNGIVVASNEESLLGQNTADNEVIQEMKKHTDSQHIYHLRKEGTGCYGIMLKQRDYYIYAYLPDTEVFHNLPLSVISVILLYFLLFGIFWFWAYRMNQAHQKQEQEKDEKYKAELLIAANKAEAANKAKTEFLQRMSHDIRTPINGICGMVNMAEHLNLDAEITGIFIMRKVEVDRSWCVLQEEDIIRKKAKKL